nr:MAG: hypothetical protein [Bacteriophage sp.]
MSLFTTGFSFSVSVVSIEEGAAVAAG